MNVIKVRKFEDGHYFQLPKGEYLVNDKPLKIENYNEKLYSKESPIIKEVSSEKEITGYTNGEMTISNVNYLDAKYELEAKGTHDEDGHLDFEDLEDEFNYKKFLKIWTPKDKKDIVIGKPLLIDVRQEQKQVNPYIKNAFFHIGQEFDKSAGTYGYARERALKYFCAQRFSKLGLEFKAGLDYKATENEKYWSNSEHSGIEYVIAFGTYVFTQSRFKKSQSPSVCFGESDFLLARYESDKKDIEDIINNLYAQKSRSLKRGSIDKLVKDINSAMETVLSIESKQKTRRNKTMAMSKLGEIKENLLNSYSENKIDN